jgi:tetratricopeptide (TPR) repeat protein
VTQRIRRRVIPLPHTVVECNRVYPQRIVVVLAAILLVAIVTGARAASVNEIVRNVSQQVVVVDVVDGERVIDSYSGVIFARGEIAVPCSGVPRQFLIRVRSGGVTSAAKLKHRDLLRNLCLLEVGEVSARPVDIATADSLRVGDRVYAISNTLGMGIAVTDGIVSGLRSGPQGIAIQFTAPVAPGSDGGGLFNEAGQLVGVIRYRQLDGQNVNFAAPAEWLAQIAARAASQTELGKATDTAVSLARDSKWEELAEHARKRLAVVRDDVEAWRWLAVSAEQRKLNQQAFDAYKEILKLEPENFSATLGRGWAQFRLGEYAAALETAAAAGVLRRENAHPWLLAASAQAALKRPQDARKSLEAAVAADPWSAEAQHHLGVWARDSGDYAAAAAAFRMQSSLQHGNVAAWIDLADAYYKLGRNDRALTAAEYAIKLDSNSGEAVLYKGLALVGVGRKSEGIKTLERGLAMKSSLPHWGAYWLASAYLDLKLYPEAIAAYRQALQSEPKFVLARQWLAWTLEQTGELEEALAEIEIVAKENPQLPWVWRRRGAILALRGMDAKAIAEYEQALTLDPRQAWVWRALVDLYRRNDRAADARRAYDRLLALDRQEAELAYRQNYLPFEASR